MSVSTTIPPSNPSTNSISGPKTKKSKKKANATATSLDDTPTSNAFSAAPVPAPLVPTENVIPTSSIPVTADEGEKTKPSGGKKGPVEEMISKRLRLLGKKIQRFKTYLSSPPEKLNADQKAALASLPTLEGAYKELDDVMKFVEVIELEQASKVREQKSEDDTKVEKIVEARIVAYQESLSTPLALFLRLRALLHPARPSDHSHLTFGHLTLPLSLQDEVRATDILRVGRMYDDLLSGGEHAQKVIDSLVKGPSGFDEEDDHIHHLMTLLDQPETVEEVQPSVDDGDEIPGADVEVEEENVPATSEIGVAATEHGGDPELYNDLPNGLPNGHHIDEEVPYPSSMLDDGLASSTTTLAGPAIDPNPDAGALNFLQADELESRDVDDDFEVLEMPPAHETSGLQPPPKDLTPVQAAVPTSMISTPAPAAFDWTAEDDGDDSVEAERIRGAFGSASGAATPGVPVISKIEETVAAAVENVSSAIRSVVDVPIVPTPATATEEAVPSAQPTPAPAVVSKPVSGSGRKPSAGGGQVRKASGSVPQKKEPTVIIDEDGFEMKVKRNAPVQTGRGGRGGRGGPGGARGTGSGRGRSGPRDGQRTTQVSTNDQPRNSSQTHSQTPRAPRNGNRQPSTSTPNAQKAQQPKPSIYKTAQPNGPSSAPIF